MVGHMSIDKSPAELPGFFRAASGAKTCGVTMACRIGIFMLLTVLLAVLPSVRELQICEGSITLIHFHSE
jgi:hypothetical protein